MSNSLASVHPELIPEWSERNLPLTPDKITFGSNKRVWWKGACGHEWETSVKARSKGEKCPICSGARVIEGINDLVTLKPLLAQEWSEKNKLKPTEVSVASQILRKIRQKNRKARQFRRKHRLRQKKANQPLKVRRLQLFRQNRRKKKRLILLQPKSQRQSHQSRQPRRLNPKNKRNSQKNRQLPNKSRLKSRLKSRQNRNRQSRPSRHSMSALMLVTQKSMR